MSEFSASFVRHLLALAERDRGSMAVLRRSMSFDPGTYPAAFPLVEGFVSYAVSSESRRSLYLLAGLFAGHRRHEPRNTLATAFAQLRQRRGAASLEKRFVALLDADDEQLPFRLRQAVSLLAVDGIGFDYERLAGDLPWWGAEDRRVQQKWARDFYRGLQAHDVHDERQ
ncbi:MAG: type I-E CRISPR-associated protein Cse2/CasB [Pseudomonadota bacterium]